MSGLQAVCLRKRMTTTYCRLLTWRGTLWTHWPSQRLECPSLSSHLSPTFTRSPHNHTVSTQHQDGEGQLQNSKSMGTLRSRQPELKLATPNSFAPNPRAPGLSIFPIESPQNKYANELLLEASWHGARRGRRRSECSSLSRFTHSLGGGRSFRYNSANNRPLAGNSQLHTGPPPPNPFL